MNRIIIFIGPEGSGKSTNAKKLSEKLGKPIINTGEIMRNLAKNDIGPLGEESRNVIQNGVYLKPETISNILLYRFQQNDVSDGLVLDGGLRTLEETLEFPKVLSKANLHLPVYVFYLHIPEELTYERLITGENARKRIDDTIEKVKSRLSKFYLKLDERLDFIKKNWNLISIDASGDEDDVFRQIYDNLKLNP